MKAAIGCLAVVGLGFVLLLGLAFFLIADTEDQGDLTKEVEVTVTKSEKWRKNSSGHNVDYTYRFRGQRFVNETWISNVGWMPGEPLSACISPDEPERHALRTNGTEVCGDDFIDFTVETAEPAP
ncbi:hypothetical protein ncot_06835 [Nocardioides sp. JQ2195]|uniref:hypothetical protein n=1 Tax=Nocardioides sp. JQ2195 TaxID=2592334 RepID=UPI00143ED088|nr:hypothetical protein [Nocardioides sp. JQ2195]QIX26347.1 hypothetical protein ncot_06835 [Nocardioides sp. JQ2195]